MGHLYYSDSKLLMCLLLSINFHQGFHFQLQSPSIQQRENLSWASLFVALWPFHPPSSLEVLQLSWLWTIVSILKGMEEFVRQHLTKRERRAPIISTQADVSRHNSVTSNAESSSGMGDSKSAYDKRQRKMGILPSDILGYAPNSAVVDRWYQRHFGLHRPSDVCSVYNRLYGNETGREYDSDEGELL